jgi:hypothetical protein
MPLKDEIRFGGAEFAFFICDPPVETAGTSLTAEAAG